MPRVSVIIPTYNRANLVREAIASVLQQSYRDLELIVVDDGSKDDTREVVASFGDSRIRYIYQENQGVSAALNTGIRASRGEYIAFCASDNVLYPDAIGKCVAFMDEHPEAGFCYGQIITIDEHGHPLRMKKRRGPRFTHVTDGKKELESIILGEMELGSFMLRRACFNEIGLFNTDLRMSEDWDFMIRLTKKYGVGHLAEPVAMIRNHTGSMTARSRVDVVEKAHRAVLEAVFNDPELGSAFAHQRKRAYFGLYCLLARVANRARQRKRAFFYLLQAVRTSPRSLLERRGLSILLRTGKTCLPRWLNRFIVRSLIVLRLR